MERQFNEDVKNSDILWYIDEYVRLEKHHEMLKDKWFKGKSLEKISEDYGISLTATKNVIYGIGDKVLLKINAEKRPN